MLNVAIIGFGLSGRYLQAPFFEANPNFNLKIILSNSQNPKEFFPNVFVAKKIDEILNDASIDLVSICSPNNTHYDYAKKVLLADKNVLVEKPFTSTVAEANELIDLAKQKKKTLTIFQNRRLDSDFLTVQKIITEKSLGEILNVTINYNRFKPELNTKQWKETAADGSGIIYDLGAHIIDQTIALFGSPLKVWGQTFTQRPNSIIDDAFDIKLDYGKTKVSLSSSLMVRELTPRYIIQGSKASFVKYGIDVQEDQLKLGINISNEHFAVEPLSQQGTIYFEENGGNLSQHLYPTQKGNWALLFQNLYEAITLNAPLLIKPEQIIPQLEIIEKVKLLSM